MRECQRSRLCVVSRSEDAIIENEYCKHPSQPDKPVSDFSSFPFSVFRDCPSPFSMSVTARQNQPRSDETTLKRCDCHRKSSKFGQEINPHGKSGTKSPEKIPHKSRHGVEDLDTYWSELIWSNLTGKVRGHASMNRIHRPHEVS